jgi:transglutaminase-like putative cysteine protease
LLFIYFGLGGGKIKRKFIHIALLFTLILALSISAASAATSNQTQKNTSDNLAAGSTSTTSSTTFTVSIYQLNKTANSVKKFIDTYNRLPNYVTVSGQQITTSQYLLLLSDGVVNLNKGVTSSITVKSASASCDPSQTVKSGSLTKTEYVKLAGNLKTFVSTNGRLPNYLSSSLGKIRPESLIYMYSKVIIFYGNNKRLPNTVSVIPWTVTSSNSSSGNTNLSQYLQPTANCQSTDATITSLSASITAGLTSNYAKAQAIFNWVRDNLTYSYYYNTKKGALGALSARTANCCDHSHLVIALARAAGLPARYQHGSCQFSDGWYGHVWAQINVDGTWYYADTINDYNTFGSINNWNLSTVKLSGTYAELPF